VAENYDKVSFYDNLQRVYDILSENCKRILVGNHNAHVGVNIVIGGL